MGVTYFNPGSGASGVINAVVQSGNFPLNKISTVSSTAQLVALVTTTLPTGTSVEFVVGNLFNKWHLAAYVSGSEDSQHLFPDDYNVSTNNKWWVQDV